MRPKKKPTVMSLMVLRLDIWGTPESNNIAGVHYLKRAKTVIGKDYRLYLEKTICLLKRVPSIEFQEAAMNESSYLGQAPRAHLCSQSDPFTMLKSS
jgi:hypothetical protein